MVFVWELLHVGPGRASDQFLTESDGTPSPSETHLRPDPSHITHPHKHQQNHQNNDELIISHFTHNHAHMSHQAHIEHVCHVQQ